MSAQPVYNAPPQPGESWLRFRLRRHVTELVRLAGPVVVSRLGIMTLALVDTLMVAQYSSEELAYQSIATAPLGAAIAGCVGLMLGTLVVTSHEFGREDHAMCGAVLRRSLPYAFWVGIAATVVSLLGIPFLRLTGQSEAIAVGGGQVIVVLGLGMAPLMVYIVASFFLEGIRRPMPVMLVMLAGNLLNVLANWVFVHGHWGLPAGGAVGSAWATNLVRLLMALTLLAYIWWLPRGEAFAVRRPWRGGWKAWAQQRRIGYAGGLSIGMEAVAFATLGIFAGWLGIVALGAHAIAFNVLALVFMIALGLASATAVRVGIAYGRGDQPDVVLAGWTGLGLNSAIMIGLGVVLASFAPLIASAYSDDQALLGLAATLIAFTAFILIADGGQVVMAHALRGREDSWVPTWCHAFSYFGVMVPLAYLLAIEFGHGVMGLFQAVLIASIVSVALLSLRFWWLSLRDRRYQPA